MIGILRDVRYGLRLLGARPGFAAVALLTIALGIGANTAIFSVVRGVLLAPLPYPDPDRIVTLHGQLLKYGLTDLPASEPELNDYRERATPFEHLAAYYEGRFNVTDGKTPEFASGLAVNAEIFPLLGVHPAIGRGFTAAEDTAGNAQVVVLSDGFWRRRFGADQSVPGRTIELNGRPTTIVGVMPPGFDFPSPSTDLWVPLQLGPPNPKTRGSHYLTVMARLRNDVTLVQASSEMTVLAQRMAEESPGGYPYAVSGWGIWLRPLHEQVVGDVRPVLLVLLGAVTCVLLIACSNVANLLLARAASRQREVALRAAVGAGRGRIVRQLLTEALVLAIGGGGLGLLLAYWGTDALLALAPAAMPRQANIHIDGVVLAFTGGMSLVTAFLFGALPALQLTRGDLHESLKDGARASLGRHGRRLGNTLVVSEVALALVLLVAAGLMIRSFSRLVAVDPGFDPRGVLTGRVFLPAAAYPEGYQQVGFADRVVQRLEALPGVTAAGVVSQLPLGGPYSSGTIAVEDRKGDPQNQDLETDLTGVSPGYFAAMQIPILTGRAFSAQDTAEAAGVAIVDEAMARRFWPDRDPLGRRVKLGSQASQSPWMTIVGVARTVKQFGLDADGREQVYFPFAQQPAQEMALVLRSAGDPGTLGESLRATVLAVDAGQPVYDLRPMEALVSDSLSRSRFSMALLLTFSAVAVVLAAVGIYGVMACSVSQRSHELGVRLALGAQTAEIFRLVLRQSAMLAGYGVVLGIAGALAATRLLDALLFRVSAFDPATYVAVSALLVAVTMLAGYLPARRATRVDPIAALRCE
jgi:putative ABC transport system permease protein